MINRRALEFWVGVFILAAFAALVLLAFRVSGLTDLGNRSYYVLTAEFDNIGDLKIRAPVAVSGVKVGKIASITLDPETYRARVSMLIDKQQRFPLDTSASIYTQGLLGSNYISLLPGFSRENLQSGQMIETTHSALILENLVGQLMFNLTNNKKEEENAPPSKPSGDRL